MLLIVISYVCSAIIAPCLFVLLRPIITLTSQLNSKLFLYKLLGVSHTIVYDETIINKGFMLSNHRCSIDAQIDNLISNSTIIARYMTILGGPFVVLLAYIDNCVLLINRDKDKRDNIYERCVAHIQKYNTRILFYPEGTRNKYLSLDTEDELRSYIKFGLLKSIYIDKRFPVQLQISNNKELVINEKKLSVNYGVHINTRISKPIHPKDFSNETEFFNEIVRVWFDCYKTTHN